MPFISLNSISQLVFVIETDCVFLEDVNVLLNTVRAKSEFHVYREDELALTGNLWGP